ncbi:hypothetical protein V5O48_007507 [Marasmius crinis-equi]|uniref:BAG domain-containing protein n=1 Tax=Marasmius crinis-equi TaxID=585013 RepID=A0ABR3FH31_9AGAR
MFSRSPYYNHHPSYYAPQDDYYYGYQNPYARAQAQAQVEQERRAQLLALERQRELQRRRAAAAEAARQQRASQYLPEAGMMRPGRNRSYVPERASRYLPDEFDNYGSAVDDNDEDAYDYGFGRAGWDGWPTTSAARPQERQALSKVQLQTLQAGQLRQRSRSRSRPRARSKSPAVPQTTPPASPRQTPISEPHSPTPTACSQPQPSTPTVHLAPTPETEEAATKIQTAYRVHRSLKSIESLSRKFHDLKSSFTFPPVVDFQIIIPEQHVSIPMHDLTSSSAQAALRSAGLNMSTVDRISLPKLAYTHANAPLHGYVESLNRLLTSLDGVESFGEKRVRERRKEVVRAVEAEAARIEDVCKEGWRKWVSILKHGDEDAGVSPNTDKKASDDMMVAKDVPLGHGQESV